MVVTEGSFSSKAKLSKIEKHSKKNHSIWTFLLENPICTHIKHQVAISKKIDGAYKLCAYGKITDGHIIYS